MQSKMLTMRKIKSSKEDTIVFLTEAVDYIKNDINMTNLDHLEDFLKDSNRGFIWNNMIKRDSIARELMSNALANNTAIALRQQVTENYQVEYVLIKKKKYKRIRDKTTGRFVSAKKKGVFEGGLRS